MEKMTKAQWYEEIIGIVDASVYENKEEAIAFLQAQIDQLAAKADKAKERAAAKKAAGDELRETVYGVVTDEFQTAEQILGQIDVEDITKAKVTARLTQLCRNGLVEKQPGLVDGKKLMTYRRV